MSVDASCGLVRSVVQARQSHWSGGAGWVWVMAVACGLGLLACDRSAPRKTAPEDAPATGPASRPAPAKTGSLEFRIAPPANRQSAMADPELTPANIADYVKRLSKPGGVEDIQTANERWQWFPLRGQADRFDGLITALDAAGRPHVLLSNKPQETMLTEDPGGWRLARVYETTDHRDRPAVGFTFDELGARRFARLTSANKEKRLAIVLDGEAFSAPLIRTTISQGGIIEMGANTSRQEVLRILHSLEAGSLRSRTDPERIREYVDEQPEP